MTTTTKISKFARMLLADAAAGTLTGMFSDQYNSPRWCAVPAIDGTRLGAFHRANGCLVTDEIAELVAAGLLVIVAVGELYTHTQPAALFDADDAVSRRHDVTAELTAAGRQALTAGPRPSAAAVAIAETLSSNPVQAAGVHTEWTGLTEARQATTLRKMIAAGDVIVTADFDGSPLYHLAVGVRTRYALAA